jgi:WD40 repeat protein
MLTWRPDGKRYLVPKHDGHGRPDDALMIDVGGPTLQVVGTVPLKARTAAYSPDGKSLALAVDREVKLWDPEGEKLRESLPSAGAGLLLLSWSPDGKTLATAGEDNKVYLFDVEAKRILAVCEGHTDMVFSLGWSDGSKTLLSGSPDETRVWDARSGKLLRTIADDGGAFSADGRLVASRGDSAVRIRQTDDGRLLRTILSLRDKQYAAISPDGHFRGSPDVEKEFVYVVQTDDGQETLTPAEFSKRFQWTNDSEKVQISPPASAPKPRAQEK